MTERPAPTPDLRWAVAAIVAAAAVLRLLVVLTPAAVHPDETFQYLEQAHRLVFGYGVVPWEYRYGMRSWLLPLVLAGPMKIGALVAPGTQLYLLLPKMLMAGVSLLILPAAYKLGARLSQTHGLIAMAVSAIWYEFAFYGSHVITEPAATALILVAAALMIDESASGRRLAIAGFLLGLGTLLRFHYLPAIGTLALLSCGWEVRRRWLPLAAGGLAALLLGAAVDLVMGQAPFGWIVANFTQNIVLNRSANYGLHPPLAYLAELRETWGIFLAPMLLLVVLVLKDYRALFWAAMVNLLAHSAIGHKEYRFIFLTVAILVILAAIGSAEGLKRLRGRHPQRSARLVPAAVILLWIGASASLAATSRLRNDWRAYSGGIESLAALRKASGLCGVGLIGIDFWNTGGYVNLHQPVPLYIAHSPSNIGPQPELNSITPAFNGLVTRATEARHIPPAYRRLSCSGEAGSPVCTFVRPGGCNPAVAERQRLDAVMRRLDW